MSETRIEAREMPAGSLELDKRQHLPFVVHTHCPKCGAPDECDLTQNYISYPAVGTPEHVYFECEGCGHEHSVRVVVGFTLAVAPETSQSRETGR